MAVGGTRLTVLLEDVEDLNGTDYSGNGVLTVLYTAAQRSPGKFRKSAGKFRGIPESFGKPRKLPRSPEISEESPEVSEEPRKFLRASGKFRGA